MKRLRAFFESIVFADLKPGTRPEQGQKKRWYAPLTGAVDRLLSGGAVKDPLYLTNRTASQKMKTWAVVAVPCILVVGLVALALSQNFFDRPDTPEPKQMTPEEVSRKILPNISKDIAIETNHDVEVVEVRVDHNPPLRLVGSLRNNSTHSISAVDVVFNLTDGTGSQVGAVSGHVENLAPKALKEFQLPISQQTAAFALVRDLSLTR